MNWLYENVMFNMKAKLTNHLFCFDLVQLLCVLHVALVLG